ncbi:MAG: DUF2202 domain-containing protein [Myxococcales bacterium]|jgi:hypothetical protein
MAHPIPFNGTLLAVAVLGTACGHDGHAGPTRATGGAAGTRGADAGDEPEATHMPDSNDTGTGADDTLTQAEVDSLRFMREEEKLARDVYLLNVESARVFANIRDSEEQHMDAVLGLLQTHGIEDPVGDRPPGEFQNDELQALYDDLAERSGRSLEEALQVAAEIEEIDILDLQEALDGAPPQDMAAVYDNLQRASRNHLRAFTRNLSMRGIVYSPLYLEPDVYQAIIDAQNERGGAR